MPSAIKQLAAITAAVMLVLSVSTLAAAADDADQASAMRSYYSANGLLNRGHYELAAAEYRSFLEAHGDHEKTPEARYGLGVCLYRTGQYEEAISTLQPLRDHSGTGYAVEVLTILGQCHLARKEYEAAADCLEVVVRRYEDHDLIDDAAALLAEAYYHQGDYEEAQAACDLFPTRWPDSPLGERAALLGSLAVMARGQYKAAADMLREMSRRYPDGAYADHAALLLAQCLHHSNSLREAVAQYQDVIRRANAQFLPDALYGVAGALHQLGQHEAAGAVVDEMRELYPDSGLMVMAALLRGRIWLSQDDPARARAELSRLTDEESGVRDAALYWLAKCDLKAGKPAAAADRLEGALQEFPESELAAEMTFDRAVALSRSGKTQEAIQQWGQFRERFPKHALVADALYHTAAAHHQLGDYEQSTSLCREFDRHYPEHALAVSSAFLAAENAYLSKDYEVAADAFETFIQRYPDSPSRDRATFRLGMAQYRLDRFEQAGSTLDRIVKGPDTPAEFRPALLALGDMAFQQEKWDAAESFLNQYVAFGLDQAAADDALLKLGLCRARKGDHESALEAYDSLLENFQDSVHHPQALFERGQALVALGRTDEAESAFEQVLETAGDSSFARHAMNHLGAIAFAADRFDDAARYFGMAADETDEPQAAAEALFQQAQALMSAKDYTDSAEVFAALIEAYPRSDRAPEARARRAIALARLDNHEATLEAIDEVLARDASSLDSGLLAAVIYDKAWCLRGLGRTDKAGEAYQDLLDIEVATDLHPHARLELAELDAEAGRYEKAARLLGELLDAGNPEAPAQLRSQAMYRLGVCEYELEDFQSAAGHLARFIDSSPESELAASAGLLCGEALYRTGAHERAASYLRRVVDEHGEDDACGPALLRLGECLAALQLWPRSEQAFADYLRKFGDSELWFQAQFGVGWALENQGRLSEAIGEYGKVVDRHAGPTAARAQFQIGECLYAGKQYEDAARELLKVDILYANPEWSAAALYEAGRCFEELGRPDEAKAQYRRVQQEHGESRWAELAGQRLTSLQPAALPGRAGR